MKSSLKEKSLSTVRALTRGDDEDGEDPDGPDDDEDEAVLVTNTSMADKSEIIRNSDQFLYQIAQQKAYVIHNKMPERCTEALNEVKQMVIDSKLTSCRKQTTRVKFFNQGSPQLIKWGKGKTVGHTSKN